MKDTDMIRKKRIIAAKLYSLDLPVELGKTIKVYVYSKNGKDIIPSFYPHKVNHIKREDDKRN